MSELSLQHLVKIYPFVKVGGTVFGRKRMKVLLERQRSQPFTTNEGVLAVQEISAWKWSRGSLSSCLGLRAVANLPFCG